MQALSLKALNPKPAQRFSKNSEKFAKFHGERPLTRSLDLEIKILKI